MKKNWYYIEDLPEYPAQALRALHELQIVSKRDGLPSVGPFFIQYRNGAGPVYCDARSWDAAVALFLKQLDRNPGLYRKDQRRLRRYARALEKIGKKVEVSSLPTLSNRTLKATFNALEKAATLLQFYRTMGWILEQRAGDFSRFLSMRLELHITEKNLSINPIAALALLLTPTERSETHKEHVALLKLARRTRFPSEKSIENHVRKYFYLTYGLIGPGMTYQECLERIRDARRLNPAVILRNDAKKQRLLVRQRTALLRQLKLPAHLRRLIDVGKSIGEDKAWSKEVQFYGYAMRDIVNTEIGRRNALTRRQIQWMTPQEILGLFEKDSVSTSICDRWSASEFLIDASGMHFLSDREHRAFLKKNSLEKKETAKDGQNVQGVPAVLGRARGIVQVINTAEDMKKMQEGNVLVSIMTQPEMVPAMRRASAIITDVGGITCHAAIVSRELGIPCVIGTKIATQVLKDGMEVEVDANTGIVKIIR